MSKNKIVGACVVILLMIIAAMVGLRGTAPVHEPQVEPEPILSWLPNPYVTKLLTEYEKEMMELKRQTKTPGLAIAVVQDSTVLMLKTFGVRDVETRDSLDTHSVFRLASVSKCFAPLLTGLLVEDGVLNWHDRVIQHLPHFVLKAKKNTDSLLLTHVLSHTTGLPYHTYTTLVEDGTDLPTMLAELRNVNIIADPGELYSYQNVAYSIIGEVIKSRTGKTYEELMRQRVFDPLNMRDASMSYDEIMRNDNVAKPHLHWRKGWTPTKISDTYYNVGPAGGVNASISDMAQWLMAMLGAKKDFVSNETLDKIFAPVVKAKTKNRYFNKWVGRSDSHYALGWRVLNFKNDTLLYHGGYVRGYRSEVAIDRRSRIAVCVLSNGPGRLIDNSVPMFFNLFYNQRDSIPHWQNEQFVVGPKIADRDWREEVGSLRN